MYEDERMSLGSLASFLTYRCDTDGSIWRRQGRSRRNLNAKLSGVDLSFVAVTSIGAIAVAMNALWQSDEMDFGLKDSGATVLIADQERLDRLALCSSRNAVRAIAVRPTRDNGDVPGLRALEKFVGPVAMPQADIASDDPVTMIYTSGTTAHPKGVVSTNRAILNALLSWELDERIGALLTGVESRNCLLLVSCSAFRCSTSRARTPSTYIPTGHSEKLSACTSGIQSGLRSWSLRSG